MNKLLVLFKTIFLLTIVYLCLNSQPAWAHRPHDVIDILEISPNYTQDQTLFIVVREKFLRSTDGGSSWTRVVQGIDNKNNLSSLAIFQKDPKILFLSSQGDGVYKSQDGGNSWLKVNNNLDNLNINFLAISPHSSEMILAAGTEGGLYKSKNGGEDWHEVMSGTNKIVAFGFSQESPEEIVIANDQGILYFSQDGGEDWQQISQIKNSGLITSILFSPSFSKDKTFWLGTEKGGIFKTVNSGISFSEANHGISDKNIRDLELTFNSKKELELFASTWNDGFFQSEDGGKNWKRSSNGLTKDDQADEPKFHFPHFSYLSISKAFDRDQTLFLAGFNGLFKSTDGGKVWRELETLSTRAITSVAISPNYQNDSTIAIGNYEEEGYISHDQGVTWIDITNGLDIPRKTKTSASSFIVEKPRFFKIEFSSNYALDKTLFASLIYRFVKSTDSGQHWQRSLIYGVSGDAYREIMIAVSPAFANDKTIYLGTYGGTIYRSTNGGSTFSVFSKIDHQIRSLVISPNFESDKTLYASGEGVYKTLDGGATWQLVTQNSNEIKIGWGQLAISPNYKVDQTVIAATNEGLFKTTDAGKMWEPLDSSAYGKDSLVEAVGISPNYKNDQTFIISIKGRGLFKTVDRGKTFKQIGKDLITQNQALSGMVMSTSTPIQFSPAYAIDQTIYGFGSAKAELFKSIDGGDTWSIIPVPKNTNKIDDFITDIKIIHLFFTAYPVLKFIIAAIGAFLSYLLLGFLRLEKQPLFKFFSKSQVRIGFSLLGFIIIFAVLSI